MAGAVGAQVVSAIAAGRRETKAAAGRRADARALAFVDVKRELFVKVLREIDKQLAGYEALHLKISGGDHSTSLPTTLAVKAAWKDMAAEVDLLAPDIVKALQPCLTALANLDLSAALGDSADYLAQDKEVRARRADLRDAMRQSLNVADAPRTRRWQRSRQ